MLFEFDFVQNDPEKGPDATKLSLQLLNAFYAQVQLLMVFFITIMYTRNWVPLVHLVANNNIGKRNKMSLFLIILFSGYVMDFVFYLNNSPEKKIETT